MKKLILLGLLSFGMFPSEGFSEQTSFSSENVMNCCPMVDVERDSSLQSIKSF